MLALPVVRMGAHFPYTLTHTQRDGPGALDCPEGPFFCYTPLHTSFESFSAAPGLAVLNQTPL